MANNVTSATNHVGSKRSSQCKLTLKLSHSKMSFFFGLSLFFELSHFLRRVYSMIHSTSEMPARKTLFVFIIFSHSVSVSTLEPCPHIPNWFACGNGTKSNCISPNQVCDGRVDCFFNDGADESADVCAGFVCAAGAVRCRHHDVCIAVPHRHLCNG